MARPLPCPAPTFASAPAVATVSAVAASASAVLASAVVSSGLKRILLVDDEAHVLRVMRLSLDRNGYEVDTALDGEVALRMLREQRYAALIVGADLAPGGRGLCATVERLFGEGAPLMLVMDEEGVESCPWDSPAAGVERMERPLSLRWIVARLNEYFGDYERR